MRHRLISFCLFWSSVCLAITAQTEERKYFHRGNRNFTQKQYAEAEVNYRKSLEQNSQNARVRYNLGNALLFQQKPKDAMKEYEQTVTLEKNPRFKAYLHHNMGVILQSQKQFGPAAECYKEALRQNPDDNESRYNLALCQYQLKKNPQNQNQEKNQDREERDKDKQQEKKQQQQDEQQSQQKRQKSEMSKDNADQLLKAAQMKENRTQEKVRKNQIRATRNQMEKNW